AGSQSIGFHVCISNPPSASALHPNLYDNLPATAERDKTAPKRRLGSTRRTTPRIDTNPARRLRFRLQGALLACPPVFPNSPLIPRRPGCSARPACFSLSRSCRRRPRKMVEIPRLSPNGRERPMLHFPIRDLFWLTLVVALALCWWTDRRSALRQCLADRARVAAQDHALQTKDAQIAIIRATLE